MTSYFSALGGHPPQTALMTQRAAFTTAYALIPGGTVRDITASLLPGWREARAWIIARPMTGFAETFCQMLMDLRPGGGSEDPEPDPGAEGALFITGGGLTLAIAGTEHAIGPGDFAYLPPGCRWTVRAGNEGGRFHWIRKAYEPVPGLAPPAPFVVNEADVPVVWMPGTQERWGTTRFVSPDDLAHDMHVTIVTLKPGGLIPFEETHVMEHGLYVLEGKAVYKLNTDWVEVEAGDFMWLRAFCPQACYAGGPGNFRYLLYKDVNRHPKLRVTP